MCFPLCFVVVYVLSATACTPVSFVCRHLRGYKPPRVAQTARSVCCCYLRSNRALWPHPPAAAHDTAAIASATSCIPLHSFLHHQNVATGTLPLIQIFHGHLPRNDGSWRERVYEIPPKGGGRNVSVISLSGSHECNITANQNAAILAQYFKDVWF